MQNLNTDPNLKRITPEDLVALDDYASAYPVRIDLVYAKQDHPDNIFKAAIYHKDARMWAHKDLAPIILEAARLCHARKGWFLELKDCLRTMDAQKKMIESDIVRAHPQWLEEPRLFSPPGRGGHPRGMAIDIAPIDKNGVLIEMGTRFDYMTEDKSDNPAARDYQDFGKGDTFNRLVHENRKALEEAMREAASLHGKTILPLPQEWWDFRFPPDISSAYAPLADGDLPPAMRMT